MINSSARDRLMAATVMTDERSSFVEALRDFCAREVGSREQRDRLTNGGEDHHSAELYAKLAELGWIGVAIPEEYGGAGGGLVDLCLLLEETAYGLLPLAAMPVSFIVAGAYERFGTEEQKRDMLGAICAGSPKCIAMSEPEAGSDVGALQCRAELRDDTYVINGQKTWISAAHVADDLLLVARSERGSSKHEGLTMLRVPAGTPGMTTHPIETMGGKEVNDVYFTDCEVPAENVLGEPGRAWTQLMAGLNVERLIIAAQMLGFARRAFDDQLAYVKERKQFGRPIGSFQVIKHRLADLATEIECCRLMVYDVAARVDANPGAMFPREASMAKLKVTEVAKRAALEGVQNMGGYGYATEYGMEGLVRTTIVSTIYGGTNEIQREIVAKTFGL